MTEEKEPKPQAGYYILVDNWYYLIIAILAVGMIYYFWQTKNVTGLHNAVVKECNLLLENCTRYCMGS